MAVVKQLNGIIKKTKGIEAWVTFGGYSALDGANVSNISTTFIVYEDWSKRGAALSQDNILANLRREVASIEEAIIFVMVPPPIRGLGQSGGFQMMVEDRESRGLPLLEKSVQADHRRRRFTVRSAQPEHHLQRSQPSALSGHRPDTRPNPCKSRWQMYFPRCSPTWDLPMSIFSTNSTRCSRSMSRPTPLTASIRQNLDDLYVRNTLGQMVPLSSLMQATHTLGSELVTRYNLYPAAPIIGIAAPGFSSGQALNLMEQVADNTLPEGLAYDWTATAFQEKQVGRQAYFIYALSITLVFLVLAALYESWTSPAAVILVVPLALVGVLLALIIRGFETDLYTQVGLVLMIALASKNAILIVEYARDLHADGMSVTEAAVEATRRRFRPIIMTSFAFILGVTPLLYATGAGAASQRAIGTVVFGGMISSTLLAIPFVPVFYVIMASLRRKRPGMEN